MGGGGRENILSRASARAAGIVGPVGRATTRGVRGAQAPGARRRTARRLGAEAAVRRAQRNRARRGLAPRAGTNAPGVARLRATPRGVRRTFARNARGR